MEFIRNSQAMHECEIHRIRNLLRDGINLFKANQAKLNEKLAALQEAQLRTDSLKNPKNGN